MPVTRRNANRLPVSSISAGSINKPRPDVDGSIAPDDVEISSPPMAVLVVQPRHPHVPEVSPDGRIFFESLYFVYSIMCLCWQYVHMYKTVWWLPQSHSHYALNFYLIDPHLAALLVTVMAVRLVKCIMFELLSVKSKRGCLFWFVRLCQILSVAMICGVFAYAGFHLVVDHSLLHCLYLSYPLFIYAVLFWPGMLKLLARAGMVSAPVAVKSQRTKLREWQQQVAQQHGGDGVVIHQCSMVPDVIREEVELFKTDFNRRVTEVLFQSMCCAYYMAFMPICFAENTLYYDSWWVGQHIVLVWLGSFLLLVHHHVPMHYVDNLVKCARHLGHWVKLEGRQSTQPCMAWSELQVWNQGVVVKHVQGLFRAVGINNAAEPGNKTHARFYLMFHSPLRVTNWLLIVVCALVMYEFVQLIQATEWSHILSLAFLLFTNYYVLFKFVRDRFILTRVHREEVSVASQEHLGR